MANANLRMSTYTSGNGRVEIREEPNGTYSFTLPSGRKVGGYQYATDALAEGVLQAEQRSADARGCGTGAVALMLALLVATLAMRR